MKQKFNEWFTGKLRNELESGKELENITIKFLLLTMKPLLAGWLIECHNQEDGLIGFHIDPVNKIDLLNKPLKSTYFSPSAHV